MGRSEGSHVKGAPTPESLAERLVQLSPRRSDEGDLVSVALGAVYALKRAVELDYSDRDITSWSDTQKAGRIIGQGRALASGRYMAGYYFNDAILRLDVAYENVLRFITGLMDYEDQETLVAKAKSKGIPHDLLMHWPLIHEE